MTNRAVAAVDRLKLAGFSAGWSAIRHLPPRAAFGGFRQVADIAWRRNGPSVRRLAANLRRAAPDLDDDQLRELTRDGVRSYFRYWCDAFRIQDMGRDEINARVRTTNVHHLWEAVERGKGAMCALPHMGNWDLAGAWACLNVSPLATVAERLEPEELFERFVAYREALGMIVLPLTGGDGDIMGTLGDHLRGGGLVCLPADRDLSGRGVPVTLFGEQTRMPAGPAMLALRTGAALVPTTIWYEGKEPHHSIMINFHEPIEPSPASSSTGKSLPTPNPPTGKNGNGRVARMTQQVADAFAVKIAEHPADWHMMQRLFLSDLRADDPRRAEVGRT